MKVLVTGHTGTLGKKLTKLLLQHNHEVIGYSRDEQKQRALEPHPRLANVIGDVRDSGRLSRVCDKYKINLIYHLAALKCVDTMEDNPEEVLKTNVAGTLNVLCAQDANRIPRVVLSSTDKACYPINIYGNTKAVAEKLILQNKNNVVCRYGNVFGSRGSVVHAFQKTLLSKEPRVEITDSRMTRFFISDDEAAQFVFHSGVSDVNGGLKIPNMKACKIISLANAVADSLSISDYSIEEVGIRKGEKIHECLVMEHQGGMDVHSNNGGIEMTEDELYDFVGKSL